MDDNETISQIEQYSLKISQYIFRAIKDRRYEKNYTILELASICDVSPGYLSDVENGKHHNTSLRFLLKICIALDLKLDDLLHKSFEENGQIQKDIQ